MSATSQASPAPTQRTEARLGQLVPCVNSIVPRGRRSQRTHPSTAATSSPDVIVPAHQNQSMPGTVPPAN